MRYRWAAFLLDWAIVVFLLADIGYTSTKSWPGVVILCAVLWWHVNRWHDQMAWPRRDEVER